MRRAAPLAWVALVAGGLAACSGGGGSYLDVDAAEIDAAEPDALDAAVPIDAPVIDAAIDPFTCGTGTDVLDLPPGGMALGTAAASTPGNVESTTCRGRGAETVYVFTVDHAVTMIASTEAPGTTLDTVLYLRRSCLDATTELGCNDDAATGNPRSRLAVDLTAGTYYLVVDGRNVGSAGNYELSVAFYEGVGAACDGPEDCAPGYTCRAIPPATQTTCERHVCGDGRDDDGDGRTDYPADPGCTSTLDDTEDDACPTGAGCPACADGADNDGDGAVDYPMDLGCIAASSDSEENCLPEVSPVTPITAGTTTGTTIGAGNQFAPTCATNSTAPDRVHVLRVRRPLVTLTIDTATTGFDTVVSLLDAMCGVTLACDDDDGPGNTSLLTLTGVPAGNYAVVVDGFGTGAGPYTLHVAGTYAAGAACDASAPYFRCPDGFVCGGTPGMETCVLGPCNDEVDDDGDGWARFPFDPGCATISDPDETDDCPTGPTCPACANLVDDDGDLGVDYPLDLGCTAASATSESCVTVDPVRPFTANVVGQSTAGLANDVDLSCGLDGRDEIWQLHVPLPLDELLVNTVGSPIDARLALRAGSGCATADLSCGSSLNMGFVAAGDYFLIVDDQVSTGTGTYNLTVSGRFPDGGACDPASPLFRCRTGFSCAGATPTCVRAACNDTVDADGDGFPGFPTDPGCTSVDDVDESDTCPAGPGCPQCSDDLDNDADGAIDYPLDSACASASGATELGCPAESDPITAITAPVTTGTTAGATNDFNPSCQTNDTLDRVHTLNLQVPLATLVIDTEGSTLVDPILMFMNGGCGQPPLACDDDGGTGTQARIARTLVPPGAYTIAVDTFGTTAPASYRLNVRGTIAAGGSCADPLVAAGVLTCAAGTTCQANVCTP